MNPPRIKPLIIKKIFRKKPYKALIIASGRSERWNESLENNNLDEVNNNLEKIGYPRFVEPTIKDRQIRHKSMAKSWVSRSYQEATRHGTQIHGGVSYDLEHDMPLYYKWAKAAESIMGNAGVHQEKIVSALIE